MKSCNSEFHTLSDEYLVRETLSYDSLSFHLFFNSLCILDALITPRVGETIFLIVCSFY